jgi:hypothetical protein
LAPPIAVVGASDVFDVVSGTRPIGENPVNWDRVAVPPAGTVRAQLRPAPLSVNCAQSQVSGNGASASIRLHTEAYEDS